MSSFTVVMAQINPVVGDIHGNTKLVLEQSQKALSDYQATVVVFPELVLTGYPPEDLLLRPSLDARIEEALSELQAANLKTTLVIGYPRRRDGLLFNMAGVIQDGQLVAEYAKQELPNYQVFDEKRYFSAGQEACVLDINGISTALTVCEDIWHEGPMAQAKLAGAHLMLNLNASPFHAKKQNDRVALLQQRAREGEMPIVYVNQVGAQDELCFDGGSLAIAADGCVQVQAPMFSEGLYPLQIAAGEIQPGERCPELEPLAAVYQALVTGVRDYVNKNGFKGVVLGLSGGIDSALTLAIAGDALGSDRVEAVMMPFRYTSDLSKNDAADQAERMGVEYRSLSIEPMYDAFMATLKDEFVGMQADTTEQNLQSRSRGVLLMAISNKKGYLVLTTGNKSELAVGYCTIYGDMAGGFDVLKDVPKTTVFELCKYRNTLGEIIPVSVIERPPSAELAPDQIDEDSLPPYEILDAILERYIERDMSANAIIADGFEEAVVRRILRLVDINEYKRRQSAIGPRISQRGFGRDRRYPITNGWALGE